MLPFGGETGGLRWSSALLGLRPSALTDTIQLRRLHQKPVPCSLNTHSGCFWHKGGSPCRLSPRLLLSWGSATPRTSLSTVPGSRKRKLREEGHNAYYSYYSYYYYTYTWLHLQVFSEDRSGGVGEAGLGESLEQGSHATGASVLCNRSMDFSGQLSCHIVLLSPARRPERQIRGLELSAPSTDLRRGVGGSRLSSTEEHWMSFQVGKHI